MSTQISKFVLPVLLSLASFVTVSAQESWHGIRPLVSTRADVEKKLGKPGANGFYELDEGRVSVDYTSNSCITEPKCDCVVPIDIVRSIRITTYLDIAIRNLNLKTRGFSMVRDTHHPSIISFVNKKTGVVYSTQNGHVTHIEYMGSTDLCRSIKAKTKAGEEK
jgi:hypothetical protein